MTEIPDILPDWHVHAWVSALVVYGVGVVGYLVAFVLAVRGGARWSRRAKLADASVDPARPLVAGEAVLVGVVEAWPDAGPAVVVEIEQHGSEHESSGSWSHVWREIDRRMRVRPFYLRHASGDLRRRGHRSRVRGGLRAGGPAWPCRRACRAERAVGFLSRCDADGTLGRAPARPDRGCDRAGDGPPRGAAGLVRVQGDGPRRRPPAEVADAEDLLSDRRGPRLRP